MAQLPALIETLGHFHPQTYEGIRHAAKSLRKAGMLTLGTGGRGAAPMTITDAVTLLLALNLSETPSGYAEAATAGFALRQSPDLTALQHDQRLSDPPNSSPAPAIVADVMVEEALVDALALLVGRADELAVPRYANHRAWAGERVARRAQPVVDVEMIHVSGGFQARVMFRWTEGRVRGDAVSYFATPGADLQPPIGRWKSIRLDEAMFWSLKRTIGDDPPWAFPA